VNLSGTFGRYVLEKSSKKRFRVMSEHVAEMNLKEVASSQPVTVNTEDGTTMVQIADEARSDWKAVISEVELYGGQHARGPRIEERRLAR